MKNNSKIIRSNKSGWDGMERKEYKTDSTIFREVSRYSLLGEGENEHELNFQTRYFQVEKGGYSSLEKHRHPHSVVVIKGSGSIILGNEVHTLKTHDVVYISPETIHQFHADNNEILGFICIVDRYRDKPVLPTDEELKEVWGDQSEARKKARR